MLGDGAVLDTEDPYSVASFRQSHAALLDELASLGVATRANETLAARIRSATCELEANILREALGTHDGNKAAAARALGIDYTTLHRKLKRYAIDG